MGSYNTARPPTERDTLHALNGAPVFLGALVSANTTTPVNNSTTATPFNAPASALAPVQVAGNLPNLSGTLAGKMLLLQPTVAGLTLPSTTSLMQGVPVVTIQTGSLPGVLIGAGERVILLMRPDMGWLQWVSNSASSSTCLVWELV